MLETYQDWNDSGWGPLYDTCVPRWWRIGELDRTPIEVWCEHSERAHELIQRADFDSDTSLSALFAVTPVTPK
ncbi:uncharacterized protein BXZ73DRAFT_99318 [Epithele typhae]|uniref:uncharacterized protein n=1 Tax=Epithele typhae TaxID=378194 RepID=UPI0020084C76|nr:uncharacterized protein BXZ73DRAFT_99318 [Epithele typhae]KAH9939695.1 hypothetical protein BXZ73DRAFT_99318 [Epithele typhae]